MMFIFLFVAVGPPIMMSVLMQLNCFVFMVVNKCWLVSSLSGFLYTPHQTLRCCHVSPDSANGRRTDRKNAKNVYPVEKVVSVAMKVVAEGVRSA